MYICTYICVFVSVHYIHISLWLIHSYPCMYIYSFIQLISAKTVIDIYTYMCGIFTYVFIYTCKYTMFECSSCVIHTVQLSYKIIMYAWHVPASCLQLSHILWTTRNTTHLPSLQGVGHACLYTGKRQSHLTMMSLSMHRNLSCQTSIAKHKFVGQFLKNAVVHHPMG